MKRHGAHSESRQAPAGLLRGLERIAMSCSCCNEGALRGAHKEREHLFGRIKEGFQGGGSV